ncbi:MAG: CapA family protein [Lachnospiraceae bacterium]|nr:CapA family protein [Lachnospiraceae bacterium]
MTQRRPRTSQPNTDQEQVSRPARPQTETQQVPRQPVQRPQAAKPQPAQRPQAAKPQPAPKPQKPSKPEGKKGHGGLIAIIVIILIIIVAAAVLYFTGILGKIFNKDTTPAQADKLPGPPQPAVESTATIGATGDILLHDSVLYGADYGDHYDFSGSFAAVAPYWQEPDLMIANLEITLGGEDSGSYRGYPSFNSPDEIVPALQDAGVDMVLTANNHTYDTGEYGMMRTLEVLENYGMDYTGTRLSTDDPYIRIKDVNGVKLGITCYTYDTREWAGEQKSLNGNVMSDEAEDKVNSFCYDDLEMFYDSVAGDLAYMKEQGCDATIFFLHFGNEYQDDPSEYQEEIAQRLCDLGVDVIIGGHPHVIQKFDILTSSSGHEMWCLYSMGNSISSQRKEIMVPEEPRGYTEDGLTIEISYMKFNNGKVKVNGIYILPTWVDKRSDGVFAIVPLDWKIDASDWETWSTGEAIDSYNRTLGRLGDVYPALRSRLGNETVPEYIEY